MSKIFKISDVRLAQELQFQELEAILSDYQDKMQEVMDPFQSLVYEAETTNTNGFPPNVVSLLTKALEDLDKGNSSLYAANEELWASSAVPLTPEMVKSL